MAAALLENLLRQQPALRRSSFSAAHAALQMNDGCLFVRCPSGLLQLLIAYCPQTARAWYQLAVNC